MILVCTNNCANAFQDRIYGKGRRAHNQTKQNGPEATRKWRCTVCGTERDGPRKEAA